MATKRQLKKFVRNSCGALAAEIILARAAFPQIDRKQVHDIVADIAALQADTLVKAGISFDKTPRDFADGHAYRKARSEYFATAYGRLMENFDSRIGEILKSMNAALPEQVREQFKEVASE